MAICKKQIGSTIVPTNAANPKIVLNGVSRIYAMASGFQVTALDDVSLEIYSGEIVALMGPSGSGKTTLLCVSGGLDEATYGSITIDGKDFNYTSWQMRHAYRRSQVGTIFQQYNLIPHLSALENVTYPLMMRGAKTSKRRMIGEYHLKQLGLSELRHKKPTQLSGGQQQRVAIARALALKPKVLLADEPTAALDADNVQSVMGILRHIADSGVAVVVGTHDPIVSKNADRVVRMSSGKIIDVAVT